MKSVGSKSNASVLIVDIRNFTPNLSHCRDSQNGSNAFCDFLSRFYGYCVQVCEAACLLDGPDSLYVNSTGDGILSVFLSPERHFLNAYLTGIVLNNGLMEICEKYNKRKPKRIPDISFGIGIDSGVVRRVTSYPLNRTVPKLETYIGNCINVAARIESITKDHARTSLLISEQVNWLLCRHLFQEDYQQLMRDALISPSAEERRKLWGRMASLNESLLVGYMHEHNLRGVSQPMPVFRLSPSLAAPGRPEFQDLLLRLCCNEHHLECINKILTHDKSP